MCAISSELSPCRSLTTPSSSIAVSTGYSFDTFKPIEKSLAVTWRYAKIAEVSSAFSSYEEKEDTVAHAASRGFTARGARQLVTELLGWIQSLNTWGMETPARSLRSPGGPSRAYISQYSPEKQYGVSG